MITKSKISAALAIVTLATSLAIPTSSAQAGSYGWGFGSDALRDAVASATVADAAPPGYGGYYVEGYRRCGFERQYNSLGYYIGTVKVCRIY